jgi:hypothetical protein
MAILIVRACCSRGHVIAAGAVDEAQVDGEMALNMMQNEILRRQRAGELGETCSICGDRSSVTSAIEAPTQNLGEAQAEAQRLESRQIEAHRLVLDFRSRTAAAARAPLRPIDDR